MSTLGPYIDKITDTSGTSHELRDTSLSFGSQVINEKMKFSMAHDLESPLPERFDINDIALYSATSENQAAFRNGIFRGKNLGTAVSDEQWAQIKAGTFDDMFIGDYWVINNITWRIAAFDYLKVPYDRHHLVILPDNDFGTSALHDDSTAYNGYLSTYLHNTYIPNTVKPIIQSAFGSEHILTHYLMLSNGADSIKDNAFAYTSVDIVIPSEEQLFGVTNQNGESTQIESISYEQFPLLMMDPFKAFVFPYSGNGEAWIRTYKGCSGAYALYGRTQAAYRKTLVWYVDHTAYVKPYFAIYQS